MNLVCYCMLALDLASHYCIVYSQVLYVFFLFSFLITLDLAPHYCIIYCQVLYFFLVLVLCLFSFFPCTRSRHPVLYRLQSGVLFPLSLFFFLLTLYLASIAVSTTVECCISLFYFFEYTRSRLALLYRLQSGILFLIFFF